MKLPVDTHTLRRLSSGRVTFPSEHENILVVQARIGTYPADGSTRTIGFYHLAAILSPDGLKTFLLPPKLVPITVNPKFRVRNLCSLTNLANRVTKARTGDEAK